MLGFCLPKQGVTSALCYLFTLLVASDVFSSHAGEERHTGTGSDTHASRLSEGSFRTSAIRFLWVVYLVASVCAFWGGPGF